MRIHSVDIRHVRQIKELTLDVSAPLTLIGGPNGAGKTTVQQAILAAMFYCDKRVRDSLVSRFDPHTPPEAILALSRGDASATVFLSRVLTDDKGEWQERGTVIKKKGHALKEVQKVFPISADAAALLLWGRQDEMTAVIDRFPSDGHSLLTNAAIRGSGPDPKEIIDKLEKDIENARKGEKGGQIVGALTQAKNQVERLTKELGQARGAEEDLKARRLQWEQAKSQRDQTSERLKQTETEVSRLSRLEELLDAALHDQAVVSELVETQKQWDGVEEEIAASQKSRAGLEKELDQLRAQHRVARDQELAQQLESLAAKTKLVADLEEGCTQLDKDLQSRQRPEPADVKNYQQLLGQVNQAAAKMEATGVRYAVSAASRPRTLRIMEDGAAGKEIVLLPGQSQEGIVGRLEMEVDGLRFTAAGKEDVAKLKGVIADNREEIGLLFQKFHVADEAGFFAQATARDELCDRLKEKRSLLKIQLGNATLASLRADVQLRELARIENNMSLKDREACAGKHLPPAAEINSWCGHKDGEIAQAKEALATLEEKRPTDPDRQLLTKNLETFRRKARESAAAFKDTDDRHREPVRELQKALRMVLEKRRGEQNTLNAALIATTRSVAELEGQLKQALPHRPADLIQADLREGEQVLARENILQEARSKLIERIEEKMSALAAHVPVELGAKITEHLARLSGGAFGQVRLQEGLAVAHVGENGAQVEPWQPGQLSYGERHQAALAVKIAVARALAETAGPVFIMLDDSLVTFDPQRRAATEIWLLDLVADQKLQVILFTCHTDWAADWKERQPDRVNYIELAKEARYYRDPPCVAAVLHGKTD